MTGQEFHQLRDQLTFSAAKLADRFDVNERTIRSWEASEQVPVLAEIAITYLSEYLPTSGTERRTSDARVPAPVAKYRDKEELTNNEAYDYIGVSRRTFLVWKNNGKTPQPLPGRHTIHDGKQRRGVDLFRKSDLEPLRRMVAEGSQMLSNRNRSSKR